MKKSWNMIPKILSGQKKIESRWYKHKCVPRGKVFKDDTIYFKNSGELVELKARVEKVLQLADLNLDKIKQILAEYGRDIGLESKDLDIFSSQVKDKKYCILIFLRDVETVEPFEIDKAGFGAMAAWLFAEDINLVKI
ncbi:MAG: hypothetical protein NTZ80_04345 [Patescibacteria group bacterium]|nr:hypothetical protein [Patescibacteria group bacterium]